MHGLAVTNEASLRYRPADLLKNSGARAVEMSIQPILHPGHVEGHLHAENSEDGQQLVAVYCDSFVSSAVSRASASTWSLSVNRKNSRR